jgi:hypothetical protein
MKKINCASTRMTTFYYLLQSDTFSENIIRVCQLGIWPPLRRADGLQQQQQQQQQQQRVKERTLARSISPFSADCGKFFRGGNGIKPPTRAAISSFVSSSALNSESTLLLRRLEKALDQTWVAYKEE